MLTICVLPAGNNSLRSQASHLLHCLYRHRWAGTPPPLSKHLLPLKPTPAASDFQRHFVKASDFCLLFQWGCVYLVRPNSNLWKGRPHVGRERAGNAHGFGEGLSLIASSFVKGCKPPRLKYPNLLAIHYWFALKLRAYLYDIIRVITDWLLCTASEYVDWLSRVHVLVKARESLGCKVCNVFKYTRVNGVWHLNGMKLANI